ncbi:hypothetical protein [Maritimibacter sp. DP1N21-5]|uniref:hypothetical protein n=1 Tax=Maritimibacter sp. DP1N21-5 TaxID=2836867 RepID=UPI001C452ADA|nr:hypothetical protein [Maritimibacter sp. DP1N21-5]MBV7410754.1 hypothetical protein [Maritimibacter sp. DP1N21-5]
MDKTPGKPRDKATKPSRDDRLKAALKANMARRKGQAQARRDADRVADKGQEEE